MAENLHAARGQKRADARANRTNILISIFFAVALVAFAIFATGCATGTGSKWYAPNTWPIFSGESKIVAAKKAEVRVEAAMDLAAQKQTEAVHWAHVEFRKAQVSLSLIDLSSETPEVQFALRALGNGLGLLNQFDPLTAAEDAGILKLVHDIVSKDAARVATAEAAQQIAEKSIDKFSRELSEAKTKIAGLQKLSQAANAEEREAHLENLSLANELRASRMRFWIAVAFLIVVTLFAIYAKFALGGVGAALHAAGAPAQFVQALDANLSSFGQWMVRTGRHAAAKAEAVLAARAQSLPAAGGSTSAAAPTPGG